MTKLDHALRLAEMGFYVFPLVEMRKLPLIDGWERKASRDPDKIKSWWTCPVMGTTQNHNVGILTTKFGENKSLIVVDVDNKKGKDGDGAVLELEMEGKDLPPTMTQRTPTGGKHLIYVADQAVKNSASELGEGLDIRSHGGFIVGAGSETADGMYEFC